MASKHEAQDDITGLMVAVGVALALSMIGGYFYAF